MKRCPFCAEEIQDAAIVCRFCQRDLPPPEPPAPARPIPPALQGIALTDPVNSPDDPVPSTPAPARPVQHGYGKGLLLLGGLLLVIVVLEIAQRPNTDASPPSSSAGASDTAAPSRAIARPLWERTGRGDDVFDMPRGVRRVRISAVYEGSAANFIVEIDGRNVISETMGTAFNQTKYEGTHMTRGGTVAITRASGVAWMFEEVR